MLPRNRPAFSVSGLFAAVVAATGPALLNAAVTPVSTSGRAAAFANVNPNPPGTTDAEQFFGGTGDYHVDAHRYDEAMSSAVSCDVSSDTTAHVDPSGESGTATLVAHWIGVNNTLPPTVTGGTFDSDMYFRYSFLTDTPGTISITVTTNANIAEAEEGVGYGMKINHTLTFDNQYTDMPLTGETVLEYPIAAGFHVLLMERHPNIGIGPWPVVDATSTTVVNFTIDAGSTPDLAGDMNCDGAVDMDDVPAMALALVNPDAYGTSYDCISHGDLNTDDLVNGADLEGFVDLLTAN